MRRTRVAALEDEVATLRQLVIEQGRQFDADLAHVVADFEQRIRALERRSLQQATGQVLISPQLNPLGEYNEES
jgi:hypothetical protein